MALETRRSRTRSPIGAGRGLRTAVPWVNVVVSESCQFIVSKNICLQRSGFMEAALRFRRGCQSGYGEAASVRFDQLGFDEHALVAVARYLQCNSVPIRCLPAADLDELVDFFDLRGLEERADALQEVVD